MMLTKRAFVALAATLTLSQAAYAASPAPATIAETAASTPQLSTLNRLIVESGLAETMKGPGPFTVFAPSDDAFKAVPAKTMAELAANKELLRSVILYHVVAAKMMAADVKTGMVKSVHGANLDCGVTGGFVTVGDALVTQPILTASNGVVHIIDQVMLPPAPRR